MVTIKMTVEEARLLTSILERELSEIRSEIHHTDDRDYRDGLKMRQRLLAHMKEETAASEIVRH